MQNPRFRHGAEQSKQIAKGEKVAGVVPHVENAGDAGAEARFALSPFAALEAPLFHGCTGGSVQ
jgi:hypothetical protein